MNKKTILFNSEASFLGTGYGVYYNKLISYMYNTGKYNIIELASFANPTDPRSHSTPWTLIPVQPHPNNPMEQQHFHQNKFLNTWGKWKFEPALCQFHPDVVCSIRDPWMSRYEVLSPLKKYYKLVTMPTVDAEPLQTEWLAMYANTDKIFTYTDWGFDQLYQQGKGNINLIDSAPPASDYNIFKPMHIKKSQLGLSDEMFIIGTVAKNQKRKLFPSLMKHFKALLNDLEPQKRERTFLYLHTCWPDIGWSLPDLIAEYDLSSHVLCTYKCKACKKWAPSIFHYSNKQCAYCGELAATLPQTHDSLTREELAVVMNLFDVYVQYASCEGFGMPAVEAASCGIPVAEVDYSAMEDVVRKLNGFPIEVLSKEKEVETGRHMAIPKQESFVRTMKKLIMMPPSVRKSVGFQCREAAIKHYNWDTTCRKWENAIDNLSCPDHSTTWKSPLKIYTPNMNIPNNLSQYDFVKWCLLNVAHRPELVDTYWHATICRDLLWNTRINTSPGFHFSEMSIGNLPDGAAYTIQHCIEEMKNLCGELNFWEEKRLQQVPFVTD